MAEGLAGCCAASSITGLTKVHGDKDIPSCSTISFFRIAKDDTKTFEFLGDAIKAKVDLGDGRILCTIPSTAMAEIKNRAMIAAADARAKELGRKDRHDLRVGDYIVWAHNPAMAPSRDGHPSRWRIGENYGNGQFYLESYDGYHGRWQRYGQYSGDSMFLVAPGATK